MACVNACEGIDSDNAIFLPDNNVRKVLVAAEIKRVELERQRDELLAALVEYDEAFTEFDGESRDSRTRIRRACAKAKSIIHRAKGGQSTSKPFTEMGGVCRCDACGFTWLEGEHSGQHPCKGGAAPTVDRLEWLESMHTLHGAVEILYVVDGYQLTQTYDDAAVGKPVRGATLEKAIDKAIAAGWKPLTKGGAA